MGNARGHYRASTPPDFSPDRVSARPPIYLMECIIKNVRWPIRDIQLFFCFLDFHFFFFFLLNIYILTMYVLDTEVHSLFRQRFVNIGDASQSAW